MSDIKVKLYNTLSNQIETFKPISSSKVSMYSCGLTVYDYGHIGNFRSFLFADIVRRFFEFLHYDVNHIMNITDVGHLTEDDSLSSGGRDKIELAIERVKNIDLKDPIQITQFFIDQFLKDAKSLGLKVASEYPQKMPRATDYISHMIDLIKILIDKGHAYVIADGTVYFDIQSFSRYGELSNNTLDNLDMGRGGRLTEKQIETKRNPSDFLLWKIDNNHLMKWDSPWGVGYPGWHIECSAMAMSLHNSSTIDIHTGGEDNIFPHHECEIAQSESATGKTFANYWLHTRFLMVNGYKMSKSKGNFYTVRDVINRGIQPSALRYELIKTHYRKNLNFLYDHLHCNKKAINRFNKFVSSHPDVEGNNKMQDTEIEFKFAQSLSNDFNVSSALRVLHSWVKSISKPTESEVASFKRIDSVLGILDRDILNREFKISDEEIESQIQSLILARNDKNYSLSDSIRDNLYNSNVKVNITKEDVLWERF